MDFSYFQSRVSRSYIPPHRTQLHPRMHSFSAFPSTVHQKPSSQSREKWWAIAESFLILPFLFYLFAIGRGIHQSSKFDESRPMGFGIIIDAGTTASTIHIFQFLNQGKVPFVQFDGNGSKSLKLRPGLSQLASTNPGNAGTCISNLLEFAKTEIPKTEWKDTKAWLMIAQGLQSVGLEATNLILDSCRRVILSSGFLFKDDWASLITGQDEGLYAWVAANYALGTLGGDPQKTTGIVRLGGASMQVAFALKEPSTIEFLRLVKLAGVGYNLYAQSMHDFGQDGAWESMHELYHSKISTSPSNSSEGILLNPCTPKDYAQAFHPTVTADASGEILQASHSVGSISACKAEALALIQKRNDECLHPPCRIVSSFLPELQGIPVPPENFFYTSELFGLVPKASLSELEAAGHHYCEDDWSRLKDERYGIDEMDLLR